MDTERKIQLLQAAYTGALVEATLQYGRHGVIDRIAAEKQRQPGQAARLLVAQMGIEKPEEVFIRLSELFGCANWEIAHSDEGFVARASACRLCALAKRAGAPQPCQIFCLIPMKQMVSQVAPAARYEAYETLWDGTKCEVRVQASGM